MSDNKEYNGWSNYETWAVNLWFTNDQSTSEYWKDRACIEKGKAKECDQVKYKTWTEEQAARFNLADAMKDESEEGIPEALNGTMYADLLNAALSEVNWYEIAASFLDQKQ